MKNLLKTVYRNPIGRTFLGLIFAFIFGTSALLLSIFASNHLGVINDDYQIKETYQFDQWTLNYDFLTLDFPEGGYIIPGYRRDRISSLLIIANGTANFDASHNYIESFDIEFPFSTTVTEVIIPIHHEDFDRLKKDTIFIEEETSYPTQYLIERLEYSKKLLFNLNIMGVEKIVPPAPRTVVLNIDSSVHGDIIYIEDQFVSLDSDNFNYSFKHPIGQKNYPLPHIHLFNVLYNLLLLCAFLGLITFITTDFEHQDSDKNYLNTVPAILHIVVFMSYFYLLKWISLYYSLPLSIKLALYLIPAIYFGYWIYMSKVPLEKVGITSEKVVKSSISAIVIFYLIYLVTTFNIVLPKIKNFIDIPLTLIIVLIMQLVIRGFIQNTLETILGKWAGLVLTSLLVVIIFIIEDFFFINNSNLILIFTGYFSLSLIISYSYHRTKNIITPTLLTLLLSLFIPNLF